MTSEPAFVVVEPGLATTLQDLGRVGRARIGVSGSGALDRDALALANALVGAPKDQAALEMRLLGPTLRLDAVAARVAVVGASAKLRIRRAAAPDAVETIEVGFGDWRSVDLSEGDTLAVGALSGSATAYLAVSGGFDAPPVLGARATQPRAGLGGFSGDRAGRALRAGDRAPLLAPGAFDGPGSASREGRLIRPRPERLTARAVAGPQRERFTEDALATFFSADWRVSKNADRMGLRLEGPTLAHQGGADIVSDGIVAGAVQTPGAGAPIVLLSDRQTAGGYAKIATVITADLPALGRAGPGDVIGFVEVSPAEGVAAARAAAALRAEMLAGVEAFAQPGLVDPEKLAGENLITAAVADVTGGADGDI